MHSPLSKAASAQHTQSQIAAYRAQHGRGDDAAASRKSKYMSMVNTYYDLVTDFYEYGWGQSFHFAPRRRGEEFLASLARHERYLADQLGLRPGMLVLDIGCGVGGPMREIARHSGASIRGVNNNAYQIEKCRKYNRSFGLEQLCDVIQADFMKLPLPDCSVDAIYAIEATCHAPDRRQLFAELRRVLKPGGAFAAYEWCLTNRYDANEPRHRQIKKGIEEGDALPELTGSDDVIDALTAAGFNTLVARDLALDADEGWEWYRALDGRDGGIKNWPRTPLGGWLTGRLVALAERVKLAPAGSAEVSQVLQIAQKNLIAAGRLGIFTPMFYVFAHKPPQ